MTKFKPAGTLAASLLIGAMTALPLAAFAADTSHAPAPSTQAPMSQAPGMTNQGATQTPSTSSNRSAMQGDHMMKGKSAEMSGQSEVKAAQQALNKQDTNANLKIDGKLGPQTRAALESFQKAHGLKATGTLNDKTETALNIK